MRFRPSHLSIFVFATVAAVVLIRQTTGLVTNGIARNSNGNIIEEFEVSPNGDWLLVPVTVAGKEYPFLVDTGSSHCCVDISLRAHLIPTGRGAKINGEAHEDIFKLGGPLVVGSHLSVTGEVGCVDLSGFREASGHDIRGILGMAFLKHFVLEIDFDSGKLALLKSVPSSAGVSIPLGVSRGCPEIRGQIEPGSDIPFIVDTGLVGPCGFSLTKVEFDRLLRLHSLTRVGSILSMRIGGREAGREACLVRFCIPGFNHFGLLVQEGRSNLIGLEYLSRYRLTLDFANGRAYLKRGLRFSSEAPTDASGLTILRVNEETVVDSVVTGSASSVAGIKAGDRLTHLNRIPADALTLHQMRKILSDEGQWVTLKVHRGGDCRMFDLWLFNSLEPPGPPVFDRFADSR